MDLRARILITVYRLFPFSLKGDLLLSHGRSDCDVSCVINFYGRLNLLEGILYCLAGQDLPKDKFEVVLVEDRNGTQEGRKVSEKFGQMLNIRYYPLPDNFGKMGYARNFGLSKTSGRFILFLDDDTVILQDNFLSGLIEEFNSSNADAVVPCGRASLFLLKGRYGFHEPHFPTSRCMAYRREALIDLAGFVSEIIGQEDVEFVIRYIAAGRTFHRAEGLEYFHPPLIADTLGKPVAVGMSFAGLRARYPLVVWILLLVNGARYLPLLFLPGRMKWRMQGRFSLGFIIGLFNALAGKKAEYC
jgi:glycosyltransferase involved in cell wall biosynthesis